MHLLGAFPRFTREISISRLFSCKGLSPNADNVEIFLSCGQVLARLTTVTCTQDRNWSVKMKIVLEQATMMLLAVTIIALFVAGISLISTILLA